MRASRLISLIIFLTFFSSVALADVPTVQERMLVSTEWLTANLTRVTVLHVGSSPAEYYQGHIPGARFLPLYDLVIERDGIPNELPALAELQQTFEQLGIGNQGRIVIYSDSELSAARAFFTLDYLGHGWRVALLDGGLTKWKAEKRPLKLRDSEYKSSDFQIRPQPQTLVRHSTIKKVLELNGDRFSDDLILIDARPLDQFFGVEPGTGIKRAGHIPTAQNLCWVENLTGGEARVLLSAEELRRLYESLGVNGKTRIIVYCRTGMQASLTYFVLRYLGYEPTLYDGSFLEWSADPDAPVERTEMVLPNLYIG